MPAKIHYQIEDAILKAKDDIDGILQKARNTGATMFGRDEYSEDKKGHRVAAISEIFIPMAQVVTKEDATTRDLFKLTFGPGTRFDDWLKQQRVGMASELSTAYYNTLKGLDVTIEEPLLDPIDAIVNAETKQVHNLSLVLPFLTRMATSTNVSSDSFMDKKRDIKLITTFQDVLVNVRKKLIDLNMESVTNAKELLELYSQPQYFECQQMLAQLKADYESKIRPLIQKADQSKDSLLLEENNAQRAERRADLENKVYQKESDIKNKVYKKPQEKETDLEALKLLKQETKEALAEMDQAKKAEIAAMEAVGKYAGFRWHFGIQDPAKLCFRELDNLDRSREIKQLIEQLPPGSEKNSIQTLRQGYVDQLLGQHLIHQKIYEAIPEGTNVGLSSIDDRRAKMAMALIADFDSDMPTLPQSLKDNPNFKRGCLEELLIIARPKLFSRSADGTQFMQGKVPVSVDSILKGKVTLGLDQILIDVLSSIRPFQDGEQSKITAYINVIDFLNKGKLNMSVTPDLSTLGEKNRAVRDQVKDMAEKLLLLVFSKSAQNDPKVQEQMDGVSKLIESGLLERATKKIMYPSNKGIGAQDWTIQRLYRERKDSAVVVDLAKNECEVLVGRVKKTFSEDVVFLNDLAGRFNDLRGSVGMTEVAKVVDVRIESSPVTTEERFSLSERESNDVSELDVSVISSVVEAQATTKKMPQALQDQIRAKGFLAGIKAKSQQSHENNENKAVEVKPNGDMKSQLQAALKEKFKNANRSSEAQHSNSESGFESDNDSSQKLGK